MAPIRRWVGWWALASVPVILLLSTCGKDHADNDAPRVTIQHPVDNSTVSDTQTVLVDAVDNEGVVRIEFYVDSILKLAITSTPYQYTWDCTLLKDGTLHTIYVDARDASGNVGTSGPITVVVQNHLTPPRETGFLPIPEHVYDTLPIMPPPGMGSLPSSVDLSPSMPPVGDQGLQGSGVGWAVGYALKSYQEQIERRWGSASFSHQFSPAYIYNQIKSPGMFSTAHESGTCDQGAAIDDALELLRTKGCATLATMPYDVGDCSETPSGPADTEAGNYRIRSWSRVDFASTDAVKRHLAGGYPVVIGFRVYKDFFYLSPTEIYSHASGAFAGDHAACVVGYDDAKSAFKILNSWGRGWSDNGYGWISYGFLPIVCREAYAAVDSIEGTPGTVTVTTNHFEATFTLSGPGGPYTGSGTRWTKSDASSGRYIITYGAVSGYTTPPPDTLTLSSGSSISFIGSYQCVNSSPLPAPTRIGPMASDICIGDRDTLMWSAVTDPSCGGSVRYDVYFGPTNPPPIIDSNKSETWYPVAGLSPATKYYWKIVATGTRSRQTSSSVWDFTTSCWTALPVPANPHPANNATCQSTTDTLTWSAVTDPCGGSVTYDVYFGTVDPPPIVDSGLTVNSFIRSGLTPNTPYYWRVSVRGDCGRHTTGTIWTFTPACKTPLPAPSNPTPATGATGQPSTVTLIWSSITDPCGGAVTYNVYFGTAEPLALVAPGLGTNSYLVGNLLSNQKYYWKVCVKTPCRDSVFGLKWDLTISCTTPLPEPIQQSPADNAACQLTTDTLRWSTVTDPCGGPITYDVYFGTASSPPKLDSGLAANSYVRSGLTANTKYYWKVCAKGTGGRETCASTAWAFTTKCTTSLPAPAGPSPADGAADQPSSLTLGWNAISDPCGGAVTYDVYAGTANPPPLVASGLTSNTHFLTGLPDDTIFWKVRVNGTCDRHVESPPWSFRVGCTAQLPEPTDPNPEDSATGQPSSLTLIWAAVIDPCGDEVKYDVYFGQGNSPPLVSSNQTNNWCQASAPLPCTWYSWKIVAKGTKSRQTPGDLWKFRTVGPALTAPSGPNPLDGATCNALVDTLTWTAAIDPCGDPLTYDVYLGTNTSSLPKLESGLTVNRWVRSALAANTKYYWKVCAKGTDSRETCSPVWSFTTGCPKSLSAPVHLLPASNATGRPTTDTLSWAAVSDSCGAPVKYEVYFGTAASPPLVDSNWSSTKYPVSGLIAYQKYYWKICARGQGGCKTCAAAVWNFQTGCPALPAPSGPTPADSALDQSTSFTLQWIASTDPCGGAVTYDVYCDTICPPAKRVAHEIVTNYYPQSGLTANKWYCWKVMALGTGSRSTTGPEWHFKTACPALLTAPNDPSPADSAACQTKPDTLRWGAAVDSCGDPVTYDVYFGTTASPPKVASALAVLKYHPTGLIDTTTYYWKVIAKGTRSRQTSSDLWNFTTKCPTLLLAPSDPTPADSATSQLTADTLRWDAVTDPCGHPVTYDVYFGTTGTPPRVATGQSSNKYPVSGLITNTGYYWKVCAKGAGGCVACSEVWIFSTGCALPKPGPHTPISGATCQSTIPTLSWAHVSDPCGGPVTYDVYLDTISPPVVKIGSDLNVNYIVPSPALLANTKYYWKVCAEGTGGRETCSDVWDFWVGCNTLLPTPSVPSPATDTTCNPIADTLTWATVTEPCGDSVVYDVYFGTANPPPLVASNLDTAAFPRTSLVANTKYYWKVCAKGPGGCQTCSPVWNFTTVCTKGLSQLTLLKPSNDSACAPFASLNLSWSNAVDTCGGPLKYDLLYDTDTSVAANVLDLDSTSTTLFNLQDNQIFYWQVRARGTCGRVTYSPKWHFTTACTTSLPLPSDPDPGDGATGTPVNDILTWTTVVDPCGGDVTYDVYFDVSNPPTTKVCSDLATAACPKSGMEAGTVHYWKVVAKGTCGRQITGPIWSFTTAP